MDDVDGSKVAYWVDQLPRGVFMGAMITHTPHRQARMSSTATGCDRQIMMHALQPHGFDGAEALDG